MNGPLLLFGRSVDSVAIGIGGHFKKKIRCPKTRFYQIHLKIGRYLIFSIAIINLSNALARRAGGTNWRFRVARADERLK